MFDLLGDRNLGGVEHFLQDRGQTGPKTYLIREAAKKLYFKWPFYKEGEGAFNGPSIKEEKKSDGH